MRMGNRTQDKKKKIREREKKQNNERQGETGDKLIVIDGD